MMSLIHRFREAVTQNSNFEYIFYCQVCIFTVFDNVVRFVGPVLVIFATTLLSAITYMYFKSVLPAVIQIYTPMWYANAAFGLFDMFNILFNYVMCVNTPPGIVDPQKARDVNEEMGIPSKDGIRRKNNSRRGKKSRSGGGGSGRNRVHDNGSGGAGGGGGMEEEEVAPEERDVEDIGGGGSPEYDPLLLDSSSSPGDSVSCDIEAGVEGGETKRGKWRRQPRVSSMTYCRKCQCSRPPRAHHCSVCKKCILNMDHHCPWVNNCVGYYNYRHFFLFLLWLWIGCVYAVGLTARPFLSGKYGSRVRFASKLLSGDTVAGHITFTFVLAGSVGVAVSALLGWHVYLVLTAQTTIEFYDNRTAARRLRTRGRLFVNRYDYGWRRNWMSALGTGTGSIVATIMPSRHRPPPQMGGGGEGGSSGGGGGRASSSTREWRDWEEQQQLVG